MAAIHASQVTFIVDMSNETLVPNCSPTLAGNFNDWTYAYNLVNQGNNIWSISIDLQSNSAYEYKFGICSWELEVLPEGGSCTNTSWGYTNRTLYTSSINQVLDTYYYGSCQVSNNDGGSDDGGSDDGGSDDGGSDDENGNNLDEWNLVWSDEFDGQSIDLEKWSYETGTGNWGWGNNESQFYTNNSNNSYIENGNLVIKAIQENYAGSNYTSARMVTRNKGDWTYGRFEIRAKLPSGVGTWPAIWMMPTNSEYGGWPDSGEIDIMEHVGFDPGVIHANCHNDTYNWNGGIPPTGGEINVNDFSQNFHVYALEWNENSIKWFVDETLYFTYSNIGQGWSTWPYDKDFYIILNIAIGGVWGGQQGIDNSIFPQTMEVDYVRVYTQNDNYIPPANPKAKFLVDMRNETVETGYSDVLGVYVSGPELDGPAGILMADEDQDGIWELELELDPGTYTYKFRNGYYNFWDGPGWESSSGLSECGVGEWIDREITIPANLETDIQFGPYCFGSCYACEINDSCSLLGDLNGDEDINVLDVVIVVNIILGIDESNICSDFNQDGITNVLDVVALVALVLGTNFNN